jgi:two-component system sensor histidine kinase TctE
LAVLEVEDDGPGMAPEDMARAWDRFHRGRGAAGQGTGLGLAIVRDIARVHGAQATLHAGPQARGLRVRVAFARADAQAVARLS